MTDITSNTYNPDVLTCIANLSNDEVFTPPAVARAMLDMLPQTLFSDPNATMMKESAVEKAKNRAVEKLREAYPGSGFAAAG